MSVSIIIPTRNREKELLATLESIQKQKTFLDSEIIIVDNGSTDNTKEVIAQFKDLPIVYEYNDIPGLLTGRHLGAEKAKGEVLCFLDDDVELNPSYIENLDALFKINTEIQLATGPCLPNYEIEPPAWLNYFWNDIPEGKYCVWLSLLDFGNQEIEIDPNFVWGLNFCIRKNTFKELGGFHPDCVPENLQQFQGDGETGLTLKAISKGYKAVYSPGLALKHLVPSGRLTEAYFQKRAFYQGVCNSYSLIRKQREGGQTKNNFLKELRNKLHPYYRWVKKIYQPREEATPVPQDIQQLLNKLGESGKNGFDFHQKQFMDNEAVRSWVLKDNYWDYNLPRE